MDYSMWTTPKKQDAPTTDVPSVPEKPSTVPVKPSTVPHKPKKSSAEKEASALAKVNAHLDSIATTGFNHLVGERWDYEEPFGIFVGKLDAICESFVKQTEEKARKSKRFMKIWRRLWNAELVKKYVLNLMMLKVEDYAREQRQRERDFPFQAVVQKSFSVSRHKSDMRGMTHFVTPSNDDMKERIRVIRSQEIDHYKILLALGASDAGAEEVRKELNSSTAGVSFLQMDVDEKNSTRQKLRHQDAKDVKVTSMQDIMFVSHFRYDQKYFIEHISHVGYNILTRAAVRKSSMEYFVDPGPSPEAFQNIVLTREVQKSFEDFMVIVFRAATKYAGTFSQSYIGKGFMDDLFFDGPEVVRKILKDIILKLRDYFIQQIVHALNLVNVTKPEQLVKSPQSELDICLQQQGIALSWLQAMEESAVSFFDYLQAYARSNHIDLRQSHNVKNLNDDKVIDFKSKPLKWLLHEWYDVQRLEQWHVPSRILAGVFTVDDFVLLRMGFDRKKSFFFKDPQRKIRHWFAHKGLSVDDCDTYRSDVGVSFLQMETRDSISFPRNLEKMDIDSPTKNPERLHEPTLGQKGARAFSEKFASIHISKPTWADLDEVAEATVPVPLVKTAETTSYFEWERDIFWKSFDQPSWTELIPHLGFQILVKANGHMIPSVAPAFDTFIDRVKHFAGIHAAKFRRRHRFDKNHVISHIMKRIVKMLRAFFMDDILDLLQSDVNTIGALKYVDYLPGFQNRGSFTDSLAWDDCVLNYLQFVEKVTDRLWKVVTSTLKKHFGDECTTLFPARDFLSLGGTGGEFMFGMLTQCGYEIVPAKHTIRTKSSEITAADPNAFVIRPRGKSSKDYLPIQDNTLRIRQFFADRNFRVVWPKDIKKHPAHAIGRFRRGSAGEIEDLPQALDKSAPKK